MSATTP
ncbi:hypothetical protein E2C01_048991 [Portunus trituberculatus]|nr:hypothetical protein [Portunus trituberculatus]